MRATAAPEEGNKVRLSVEIDETEMDEALDEVMRRLSREVRVPGFRPGKVPRRVLEARMGGPAALRVEAIREALPDFYARAVTDAELDPIDQPEIDITSGDESGAVSFDAVVMVRPTVAIPGYGGLVVTLPGLDVPDDEITAQIDRLRATSGELAEVTRPARDGDQVTIDIHGTREGAEGAADDGDLDAEDLLYEVGSGGVVPDLDDQLRGDLLGHQFDHGLDGLLLEGQLRLDDAALPEALRDVGSQLLDRVELGGLGGPLVVESGKDQLLHVLDQYTERDLVAERLDGRVELEDVADLRPSQLVVEVGDHTAAPHLVEQVLGIEVTVVSGPLRSLAGAVDVDGDLVAVAGRTRHFRQLARGGP